MRAIPPAVITVHPHLARRPVAGGNRARVGLGLGGLAAGRSCGILGYGGPPEAAPRVNTGVDRRPQGQQYNCCPNGVGSTVSPGGASGHRNPEFAPLAQLDRASVYGTEGCPFESGGVYFPHSAPRPGAKRCTLTPIGAVSLTLVTTCGDRRVAVLVGLRRPGGAIWRDLIRIRREASGTIFGTSRHHCGRLSWARLGVVRSDRPHFRGLR